MKNIVYLTFLFFILIFPLYAQNIRYTIHTSHSGAVTALQYHEKYNLLISSGEDGTIRIWDTSNKQLLHVLRIAYSPIITFKIHPQKQELAVLTENQEQGFLISVWDWEKEKKLYSIPLYEQPLFIDYSIRGSFLTYGLPAWKSLYFHNSQRGSKLSYLSRGFGIVSFVTFSSKENTVMTYQPSGQITYWDIKSGRSVKQATTLQEISAISLSADKRSMVGYTDGKLVVVDLLNGAVTDYTPLSYTLKTAIDPGTNTVTCIYKEWGETKVGLWQLSNQKLIRKATIPAINNNEFTSLVFMYNTLYIGSSSGTIFKLQSNNTVTTYLGNSLLPITDISIKEDRLVLASDINVIFLISDFFNISKGSSTKASRVDMQTMNNPFYDSPIGLDYMDNGNILIWRLGEKSGAFSFVNPYSRQIINQFFPFQAALKQFSISRNSIISIEKTGLCKIIELNNNQTIFQYPAPGMNKIAYLSDTSLICGRSKLSDFDSPLMLINWKTGETVMLSDSCQIINDLIYDESKKRLYTIGFDEHGESNRTVLKVRSGQNFQNESIIFSAPGEVYTSSMVFDKSRNVLYFYMGGNIIYTWDGRYIQKLEYSSQFINKLYIFGDRLYSLNKNSSISVWNISTKKKILDFFLFRDFSWLILTKEGKYYSYKNGESYLSINGQTVTSTAEFKKKYKLEL